MSTIKYTASMITTGEWVSEWGQGCTLCGQPSTVWLRVGLLGTKYNVYCHNDAVSWSTKYKYMSNFVNSKNLSITMKLCPSLQDSQGWGGAGGWQWWLSVCFRMFAPKCAACGKSITPVEVGLVVCDSLSKFVVYYSHDLLVRCSLLLMWSGK